MENLDISTLDILNIDLDALKNNIKNIKIKWLLIE